MQALRISSLPVAAADGCPAHSQPRRQSRRLFGRLSAFVSQGASLTMEEQASSVDTINVGDQCVLEPERCCCASMFMESLNRQRRHAARRAKASCEGRDAAAPQEGAHPGDLRWNAQKNRLVLK